MVTEIEIKKKVSVRKRNLGNKQTGDTEIEKTLAECGVTGKGSAWIRREDSFLLNATEM